MDLEHSSNEIFPQECNEENYAVGWLAGWLAFLVSLVLSMRIILSAKCGRSQNFFLLLILVKKWLRMWLGFGIFYISIFVVKQFYDSASFQFNQYPTVFGLNFLVVVVFGFGGRKNAIFSLSLLLLLLLSFSKWSVQ